MGKTHRGQPQRALHTAFWSIHFLRQLGPEKQRSTKRCNDGVAAGSLLSLSLILLIGILIPAPAHAAMPSCYDGTYTVPAGVTQINIDAIGAAGGTGGGATGVFGITHGGGVGGQGAWVSVIFVPVTPGQILYYGAGSNTVRGGVAGPGPNITGDYSGGYGGNGSFVSTAAPVAVLTTVPSNLSSSNLSQYECQIAPSAFIVVAAGGGGGGGGDNSGPGGTGGAAGSDGLPGDQNESGAGGQGSAASATSGGAGGAAGHYFDTDSFSNVYGQSGFTGGQGGSGVNGGYGGWGNNSGGGGGGGGWYGGGGGGGDGHDGAGGGGGGSSFVSSIVSYGHGGLVGPISLPASVTITPILTGQITLGVSPNPVVLGQSTTLTGTVSPASLGGTFSFFTLTGTFIGGGNANSSGAFSMSYTPTVAGTVTLFANWNGTNANPAASNHVDLVVTTAPAIVTQPSDVTKVYGQLANFTIAASGVPTPAVQWQVSIDNGATWNTIAGANSLSYSSYPQVAYSGYLYRAQVSNSGGTATSNPAKLTESMATLAVQPKNASMTYGGAVPTIGAFYTLNSGGLPPGDPQASLIGTIVCDTNPSMTTNLPPGTYTITCSGATSNNFYIQYYPYSSTLTVSGPPIFTSAASATFVAQSNGSFTVTTAPGYPGTTALTETGVLPAGVTFVDHGNGTGTLSGPSGAVGSYAVTLKAVTGSYAAVTQSFTLNVSPAAPTFTSAASTTFSAGQAGTFAITTLAYPKATISASGTLPGGIAVVDNGNGTATLAGAPVAGSGGSYSFILHASNGTNPDAAQTFTLNVQEAPTFTSANAVTFVVGTQGVFPITATPGYSGPLQFSEGTDAAASNFEGVPAHIFIFQQPDNSLVMQGTPGAGSQGVYHFNLAAQNDFGTTIQAFTLTITSAQAGLSAVASSGVVAGGQISDSATLTGVYTPSGTITFNLYTASDSNCSATPLFTQTKTVSGSAVYTSNSFTTTSAGTYHWQAAYSGDSNNLAVTSACSDAGQSVVVSKASPTMVGTASAAVAFGGSISDQATLASGFTPTGTLVFTLYSSGDTHCNAAAIFNATTIVAGNGSYASGAFVAPAAGTYQWTLAYSGDANNLPTNTTCNVLRQSGLVNKANQTITFGALTDKVYGAASFSIAAASDSNLSVLIAAGPAAVCSASGTTISLIGVGTCSVSASQAGDGNYNAATSVIQPFSVSKATLTVTADSLTRLYNTANPALTYKIGGYVNGDGASVVSGAPGLSTTAAQTSPVGGYPITVTAGNLAANNYVFNLINGSLGVGITSQTITFGALTDKVYGALPVALTASSDSNLGVVFTASPTTTCTVSGATVSLVGIGTCSITAGQAGDTNYNAATPVTQSFNVTRASLIVTADSLTRLYNVANPVLTYEISGYVNGDSASVVSGVPALSVTATQSSSVGSYPITVAAGTLAANNYIFNLVNGSLGVGIAAQTIRFGGLADQSFGVAPITVAATSDSGLSVTFAASPAAVCSNSGAIVSLLGIGTCNVTATQVGNTNYNAATPVTQTFNVRQAGSSTALTSNTASSVFGQSVTFTATLTTINASAGGSAAFTDSGTPLAGCGAVAIVNAKALCTIASLSVATHAISATYTGDPNTLASASPSALGILVNKAATAVALTPPAAITLGSALSVSASVAITSPGAGSLSGTLTISDGAVSCQTSLPVTTCSLTPLTAGAKTLTATYAPDAVAGSDFIGSSGTVSLIVNPATPGIALTSSVNPSVSGQSILLTATVTPATGSPPPTGSVSFSDGSTNLCATVALTNGLATCSTTNLTVGSHRVQAIYSGDSNTVASTASLTQVVNFASASLTLTASDNPLIWTQPLSVTVSTSATAPGVGTPTGSIVVNDGTQSCTIALPATSCSLTPSAYGTLLLTASYSGDENFAASRQTTSINVDTAHMSVSLTCTPIQPKGGDTVSCQATCTNDGPVSALNATCNLTGTNTKNSGANSATVSGNVSRVSASSVASPSALPGNTPVTCTPGSPQASLAMNSSIICQTHFVVPGFGNQTSISASSGADDAIAAADSSVTLSFDVAALVIEPAPMLSSTLLTLLALLTTAAAAWQMRKKTRA